MINTELISILKEGMAGSSMRHTMLANNIANVNTPGYKRSDIDFKSTLAQALDKSSLRLKTTHPVHFKHLGLSTGPVQAQDLQTSLRNDGNNVDVDMELATMAENNLYFNSLAQLLSSQLSLLRQSIMEGRR
ncbi:MAG TPA: flagellar basal body rod protein FlgB [Peptococcaceae bacterium]|jgi:flagellar basal-body rod protein FlgB|nr:flagellar basal body rod protein FlgB [Peptococcaceae bacterium]HPZ70577.1 flagellar basal body rod protein FlgB [Peptococcaceae bacterium]HQD53389.1 flagellar basal body rod protein FlgB [Peptococcaceae bacterium]